MEEGLDLETIHDNDALLENVETLVFIFRDRRAQSVEDLTRLGQRD
jgi:hypothetical protein